MAGTFLLGSLVFTCQFKYFYESKFESLGVINQIGIEADASEVAYVMVEYLRGNLDEFQLTAKVNGVERELFNPKEQMHMHDIVQLIKIGNTITLIGVIMIVTIYGLCILRREREILKKGYKTAFFSYIFLLLGLSLVALLDFNEAFILFHKILFTNDLWLLDPSKDILLMLMPLEFFIGGLKFVLITATLGILITGVITWLILRKIKVLKL